MRHLLLFGFALITLGGANCDNPCVGGDCPDVPKPDIGGGGDPSADFCAVYDQVLVPECSSCHSPSGSNLRPYLSTSATMDEQGLIDHLVNGRGFDPEWLVPGAPDESHIWARVEEGDMPPGRVMMGGSASEDARLRKLLRDWISNGASTVCNDPVQDAGVAADAGPGDDAGSATDTGSPADSGGAPDVGSPADSGVAPDAGSPADSGVAPDAGSPADSGVAPDTGSVPDSGPAPDAGAPLDPMCGVLTLIGNTCRGCHGISGGLSVGDGTLASLRANLAGEGRGGAGPYLTPGNPGASYFYLRIAGRGAEVGGRAARMPLGGQWPIEQINTLEQWILDGAPDFVCP